MTRTSATTLYLTIAPSPDAFVYGALGSHWRAFPPVARAAAWCAALEARKPGSIDHERAAARLDAIVEDAAATIGASRARDQLILGREWWRVRASRRDQSEAVAA